MDNDKVRYRWRQMYTERDYERPRDIYRNK